MTLDQIRIERAETRALDPGQWHPITSHRKKSARMACPGCGSNGSLIDHRIDAAGNVTPSVDCTECEYHMTGVVLLGWP